MNKSLLAIAIVIALTYANSSFSQDSSSRFEHSNMIITAHKSATINVRSLFQTSNLWEPDRSKPPKKKIENEYTSETVKDLPVPKKIIGKTFKVQKTQKPPQTTGSFAPSANTSPITVSTFPALIDDQRIIPPDCAGAVGPNHVMTVLNSQINYQDKNGNAIFPDQNITLDQFFSLLPSVDSVFDPRVIYDNLEGHWIITASAYSNSKNSMLLLAISDNQDPTMNWKGYSFKVDRHGDVWLDYPCIGFNKNWIVISGNLYTVETLGREPTVKSSILYILDKHAIYNGSNKAIVRILPESLGTTLYPALTYDKNVEEEYLVNTYSSNSSGKGYLHILSITGSPDAPQINSTNLFPNVNVTWRNTPNNNLTDFSPQNAVPNLIQNNDSRMQGAVYRNGFLWCVQTVFLPTIKPTHAAIQWWQIDPTTAEIFQFARIEDKQANGFAYYAFPSISVNQNNDVLIGYSSFAANQYASGNYSFRSHADPANTMQKTIQFIGGTDKYYKTNNGSRNRWGDYTTTCADPDGISLWSLQQFATAPFHNEDRWGTQWICIKPR